MVGVGQAFDRLLNLSGKIREVGDPVAVGVDVQKTRWRSGRTARARVGSSRGRGDE